MASSFWKEDAYGTHFYCALCGGPFARVVVTADEESSPSSGESLFRDTIRPSDNVALDAKGLVSNLEIIHPLDLELGKNKIWSNSTISRRAYDGTKLKRQNYKWTRVLRALINKHAKVQPEGGLAQLNFNQQTYLSGRGKVREDGSWADAYASVESEPESDDEDETGLPRYNENCGFHLYQEPDRDDRKFRISSIPFHDECWNILDHAFQMARTRRGIGATVGSQADDDDEHIDTDELWSYLNELIPMADTENVADLTTESLRTGAVSYVITRLSREAMGNGGYLAAESSASGLRWLHQEGLHWLVADPSETPLLRNPLDLPLEKKTANEESQIVLRNTDEGGRKDSDPFSKFPHEVLVETISYLTCRETFRWRMTSPTVNRVIIPQREYRRFIREEMEYLPKLFQQTEAYQYNGRNIDWRRVFEWVSAAHRNDDSLRNRRRIWKILQPIAEEVVERSKEHLMHLVGDFKEFIPPITTVVRGKLGTLSGAEGGMNSILFFFEYLNPKVKQMPIMTPSQERANKISVRPSEAVRHVDRILIWLDPITRYLRGFEIIFRFHFPPSLKIPRLYHQRLGSHTILQETYIPREYKEEALTGVIASWSHGLITGISFTFEEADSQADEFNRQEARTPHYGIWENGGMRRLVSPRKYRTLAGITAFIDSAGFFETLAIFEESKVINDVDGSQLYPPKSVPLSHQEASLWTREPPTDISFHDREGPAVGYWKLTPSQWGLTSSTPSHELPGQLLSIVAYTNGEYLAGLRLWFQNRNFRKRKYAQELGNCAGTNLVKFDVRIEESIRTVVIGHSPRGIHSLQLLLSSGIVSPVFGSRYFGIHSVYAVEDSISLGRERLGQCQFLRQPIIGFHCLYEEKLDRIIQLGVITVHPRAVPLLDPISPSHISLSSTGSAASSKSVSLPFIETDEHKSPWVDFPPPSNYVRAGKRSESPSLAEAVHPTDFAGWVSFQDLIKTITIFGQMEGIVFTYWNDKLDARFGNTSRDLKTEVQRLKKENSHISSIATSQSPQGSLNLKFFAGSQIKPRGCFVEIESNLLIGIKLNFTRHCITQWYPLVDSGGLADSSLPLVVAGQPPQLQDITPTSSLFNYYRTITCCFENLDWGKTIDGIRGYSMDGKFCGLRLRRDARWDPEPLGMISAYQIEFMLEKKEKVDGIYRNGMAVALCTDYGRVTPWIGDPDNGETKIEHIICVPKSRPIGIFLTYSDPLNWKKIGLLCRAVESPKTSRLGQKSSSPKPPAVSHRSVSPATQYEWIIDPAPLMQTYKFLPLKCELHPTDPKPIPERAYTLYDPNHLTSIEAYVNDISGRFGLKALKFQGDPHMGEIRLGNWQDQFASPLPEQKMVIEGAKGERITGLKINFHRHEYGDRIIGLTVYTNWEQEHDIVAWREVTTEPPPKSEVFSFMTSDVDNGTHICGFHYVIGVYVHDIQLITELDQ